MSRADIDSVLRKVRALRDLAARAGTLAEAQTAAAQADAILQKHRLTDADVEASTGVANEAISDAEEPLWSGGARLDTTASRLAAALGEHYGCAIYSSRDYFMGRTCKIEIKVAGRSSDVACLRYMFAWLRVEIDRLAQAHRAATRGSFKHGAVSGIALTLRRSAQSAAAEHGATGAPLRQRWRSRRGKTRRKRGLPPHTGRWARAAIVRAARSTRARILTACVQVTGCTSAPRFLPPPGWSYRRRQASEPARVLYLARGPANPRDVPAVGRGALHRRQGGRSAKGLPVTPAEYTAHTWPDEPGRYAYHAPSDERRSVLPCADTDRCPPSSQHTDRQARVTVLPLPPLPKIEE